MFYNIKYLIYCIKLKVNVKCLYENIFNFIKFLKIGLYVFVVVCNLENLDWLVDLRFL